MVRVSCLTDHKIVEENQFRSSSLDLNFVATVESKSKTCLNILRVEDASLSELYELSSEIFENVKLPGGGIFLYGSASRFRTGVHICNRLAVRNFQC